jgi:hypothetical protein
LDLLGCPNRAGTLTCPLMDSRPLLPRWDTPKRLQAPEILVFGVSSFFFKVFFNFF